MFLQIFLLDVQLTLILDTGIKGNGNYNNNNDNYSHTNSTSERDIKIFRVFII